MNTSQSEQKSESLRTPDTQTLNIKFNYATLVVGTIATVVVVVFFLIAASHFKLKYEVRDVIAMVTCGIVSTTLIYNAKNLRINFAMNKVKLEFETRKYEEEKLAKNEEASKEKIQYSFELTMLWFKPEMAKNVEISRGFLLANRDALVRGDINSIVKELDNDIETRKSVVCVLNYFENLSILIKNGIVNEDSIKQCFKTAFLDYYKVLRRYIDEIQKSSTRYLMNYEEIARRWEKS